MISVNHFYVIFKNSKNYCRKFKFEKTNEDEAWQCSKKAWLFWTSGNISYSTYKFKLRNIIIIIIIIKYLRTCLFTYLPAYLLLTSFTDSHLLTKLLTPFRRDLLKKVTGSQLLKKFPPFYGTRRFITYYIFLCHLVVCLTTGPKSPQKRALHIVRSRASSFNYEYPFLSLRQSSSFLRLLPRLPVTSIPFLSFLH